MSEPKRAHTKSDNKHRQEYDKGVVRDAVKAAGLLNSEPTKAEMRKQAYRDLGPRGHRGSSDARQSAAQALMRAVREGHRLPKGDHEGLMRIYKEAAEKRGSLQKDYDSNYEEYKKEKHKAFAGAAANNRDDKSGYDRLMEHHKAAGSGKSTPQRFLYKKVKDPVKK